MEKFLNVVMLGAPKEQQGIIITGQEAAAFN